MAIDKSLWLSNPDHNSIITIEMDVHNPDTEEDHKVYLSSKAYVTENTIAFDSRIIKGPTISRPIGSGIVGKASVSAGNITLDNSDGAYDFLLLWAVDGRNVVIRTGDVSWPHSEFIHLLETRVKRVNVTAGSNLIITLYDKMDDLNVVIQPNKYTDGDSEGQEIPLCFGEVYNISPKLLDSGTRKYQVHDGEIQGITSVYDGGLALPEVYGSCKTTNGYAGIRFSPTKPLSDSDIAGAGSGKYYITLGIDDEPIKNLIITFNNLSTIADLVDELNRQTGDSAIWIYPQPSTNGSLRCQSLTKGVNSSVSITTTMVDVSYGEV